VATPFLPNWAPGAVAPACYSNAIEEYLAAKVSAGVVDWCNVGRIRLTGHDGLDLLNRLSTNDLLRLTTGTVADTVLTTEKGRIVDLLTVHVFDDHLLVLTSPGNQERVLERIGRFTFSEDVNAIDVTADTGMFSLYGPKAQSMLETIVGQGFTGLSPGYHALVGIAGTQVTVALTTPLGGRGFNLVIPGASKDRVWAAVLDKGQPFGAKPIGTEAFEILRVEAGIPVFGKELDERFNPIEAGLASAISFTKGCYVGQEVIARLNTYQKVQRQLVGLAFDSDLEPRPGSKLLAGEAEEGLLTSVVMSPALGRPLGLGYVRLPHAKPGSRLLAVAEGRSVRGEVVVPPVS